MFKRKSNKALTMDRMGTKDFHTVEQLGPKQSMTPEGFLLCQDVPVARVGVMLYGPGEVPISAGPDGVARVERGPEELFREETIASYNGKPVVNEHPDDLVDSTNWQRYSVGTVLNPRRGEGEDADVMLADLLITDMSAIRDVRANKREVSAGYTADYEQTGEGAGRQANIIGNHVALVQRGRCGPRCAIGDHDPTLKGNDTMPTPTLRRRQSAVTIARRVFRDAEEDLAAALADADGGDDDTKDPPADDTGGGGGGDGHTHIHIHTNAAPAAPAEPAAGPDPGADPAAGGDPTKSAAHELGDGMDPDETDDPMDQRMKAVEAAVAKITKVLQKLVGAEQEEGHEGLESPAPVGEGDQQTKDEADPTMPPEDETDPTKSVTQDSAALSTNFQRMLADAEVLVPGFRMPTFDAAKPRKLTIDAMCSTRRAVLGNMVATRDGASLLSTIMKTTDHRLDYRSCGEIATIFKDAAAAKKAANNNAATKDAGRVPEPVVKPHTNTVGKFSTPAELNSFYAKLYAKKV